MVDITVESTVTPWTSRTFTLQSDGVVPERKGVDDGPTTTSRSATAIVPNQILGKLESKQFQVLEGARA